MTKEEEIKKAVDFYREQSELLRIYFNDAQDDLWKRLNDRLDEIIDYEPPKRDCF